ncbi:MAG TPA: NAD(P)-dependent oxidoreductase [Chloroflexota bacterium]|nr:NAD(P)-dependent oxidoreductase [Chloroflexota bacterium]
MRVVITGASGLIGTNLALRLLDEGHEVFGVDKDPNPWTARVPVKLEDLRSTAGEPGADWGDADVVVHLAARAKVHESVEHPENALANYTITNRVLQYCRRRRTPIIFGSSRESYGEPRQLPVPEDAVRVEGAASPYAAAKIADEALIRAYARCYGIAFLIFRFSNVYGRYDDLARNGRFIPLLCYRIPRRLPITLFGPHKTFDFTYIDDAIDGVTRGLERLVRDPESVGGHAINLGTGHGTTLLQAAELVGQAAAVEPQLSFSEMKVGEISRYVADLTKARTLLGYDPKYPASRGIPEFYRWWQEWYGTPERAAALTAAIGS